MGVSVAYIALYNQSRSNGRLRDITLRCSPTLVRYAMEEVADASMLARLVSR